jgi:chorismate synthase
MNSFGRFFRINIFGESHGESLGILIDGCPPGLPLEGADFTHDLERRKSGAKGTTPRKEPDIPAIRSGVFNGRTTGAPILIFFENKEADSSAYEQIRYMPRPGHADFTAWKKYRGFNDYRGGGHFSGRLMVGLVAAGVIAKKLSGPVTFEATLIEAGGSKDVDMAVEAAMRDKDSIGGIVECRISNVPVGLGEPFFDSVESLISHIVFSVPAVKAIEFGAGFAAGRMRGSEHNDEIINISGLTQTNNAGGINGGITNGNDVVFRVAVKPPSSIARAQSTIDMRTNESVRLSVEGRHDVCIALRVPVIMEAVAAIVFADLMHMEKK